MANTYGSRQALLDALRKNEQEIKEAEMAKRKAEFLLLHGEAGKICKNCANKAFYRKIEPTGTFTETSEFCACKLKLKMVDPNGTCEKFGY